MPLESEHEIYWYWLALELNPGSSDRPSRSVRTVSQSPEPPRQVKVLDIHPANESYRQLFESLVASVWRCGPNGCRAPVKSHFTSEPSQRASIRDTEMPDVSLFKRVLSNEHHVLQPLLSERNNMNYTTCVLVAMTDN